MEEWLILWLLVMQLLVSLTLLFMVEAQHSYNVFPSRHSDWRWLGDSGVGVVIGIHPWA